MNGFIDQKELFFVGQIAGSSLADILAAVTARR
jgi:hypothetical protein